MHFTHQGNPHNDKTIERLMAYSDTLIEMIDLFNHEFTAICPEDADNPQVYADLVGVAGEDDENIENYKLGKLVEEEMDRPLSDVVVAILEAEFAVQRLGRKLQDEVAKEKGLVYLIGNEERRILKIGYTRNLEQRFQHINSRSAYAFELIKTKAGTRETEKQSLLNARKFRIGNELFAWDDSIVENFDYNFLIT